MRLCSKKHLEEIREEAYQQGRRDKSDQLRPIIKELIRNNDELNRHLAGMIADRKIPVLDLPPYRDKKKHEITSCPTGRSGSNLTSLRDHETKHQE
ncbi:MAG TPA: hypothetical protein ENO22_05860 [candidate division Zixibacteria bacterium]|nr:hypothetical protein [candidate division Zixibacteria bacterium]HEQ98849.1 hypothetical protein [candidate division Zixibacteria bacterium]